MFDLENINFECEKEKKCYKKNGIVVSLFCSFLDVFLCPDFNIAYYFCTNILG